MNPTQANCQIRVSHRDIATTKLGPTMRKSTRMIPRPCDHRLDLPSFIQGVLKDEKHEKLIVMNLFLQYKGLFLKKLVD